jgi:hypothetical protein
MILFISVTCLVLANARRRLPDRTKKSQRILYDVYKYDARRTQCSAKAGQLIMHGGQPAAAFCPFNLRQMRPLFAALGTQGIRDHRNSTKAVNIKIKRERSGRHLSARVIKPRRVV